MNNCHDIEQQLLQPQQSAALREHLRHCPDCAAFAQILVRVDNEPLAAPPPALDAAIRRAAAEHAAACRNGAMIPPHWRRLRPVLAVAAALALSALLAVLTLRPTAPSAARVSAAAQRDLAKPASPDQSAGQETLSAAEDMFWNDFAMGRVDNLHDAMRSLEMELLLETEVVVDDQS